MLFFVLNFLIQLKHPTAEGTSPIVCAVKPHSMVGCELPQVFLKPIDPHAPRNRKRTGAFEVQLCFHSRKTRQLEKLFFRMDL